MKLLEYLDIIGYWDEVLGEGREELSAAFAICTAKFKQMGALAYNKHGELVMTNYGKALHKKHMNEPDHKKKVREYEAILKANRKGPRRRDDKIMPAFMQHCVVAVYKRLMGKKEKESSEE